MSAKNIPVLTIGACLLAALGLVIVLSALGEFRVGAALGLGLVLGSTNGLAVEKSMESGVGPRASSLLRLSLLTVVALGASVLLGLSYAWLVVMGVAGAQLVLVASAARSLLSK